MGVCCSVREKNTESNAVDDTLLIRYTRLPFQYYNEFYDTISEIFRQLDWVYQETETVTAELLELCDIRNARSLAVPETIVAYIWSIASNYYENGMFFDKFSCQIYELPPYLDISCKDIAFQGTELEKFKITLDRYIRLLTDQQPVVKGLLVQLEPFLEKALETTETVNAQVKREGYNEQAAQQIMANAKANLEQCREKAKLAEEFLLDLQNKEKDIASNLRAFRKAVDQAKEIASSDISTSTSLVLPRDVYKAYEHQIAKLFR